MECIDPTFYWFNIKLEMFTMVRVYFTGGALIQGEGDLIGGVEDLLDERGGRWSDPYPDIDFYTRKK